MEWSIRFPILICLPLCQIPGPGFQHLLFSWLGINPNQSGYYNYGDYFNESADANAAAFYAQGMADLAKQIAAVRSRGVFTTESLEANAKLLDNMPEGSMVTFYSDGTFVVNFWARGSKSKDDGSVDAGANTSHLLAFGGGKGAVGGILGALGLDDPIGLIFMPGSLSDGMTPAQIMAEMEEMQQAQQQYNDMVNWLSGNGWMLSKGGTQVNSKTLWRGEGNERIDVENPAPTKRPGQIHYQDNNGNKYIYDPNSDRFINAPKSVNELLNNPRVRMSINRGLMYLGF